MLSDAKLGLCKSQNQDFLLDTDSCLLCLDIEDLAHFTSLYSGLTTQHYQTRVARFKLPLSTSRTFLLRHNKRIGVPLNPNC